MARMHFRFAFAFLVAGFVATPAWAQIGSSGMGSSSSGRSTGTGGLGSSTGGMGGLASQSRSNANGGLSQNMTGSDFRNNVGGNLLSQSFGFGSNTGGRGMGAVGMGMGMGMGMGGMGMGMGMGMGRNGQMNQFGNMNQQQQNARPNLKFPLRLGFSVPATEISARATQFQSRVARLPSVKTGGNVTVKMDGTTAILQGTVSSEQDRDLVERLALLEPGIEAVQNDLEIAPSEDSASR